MLKKKTIINIFIYFFLILAISGIVSFIFYTSFYYIYDYEDVNDNRLLMAITAYGSIIFLLFSILLLIYYKNLK